MATKITSELKDKIQKNLQNAIDEAIMQATTNHVNPIQNKVSSPDPEVEPNNLKTEKPLVEQFDKPIMQSPNQLSNKSPQMDTIEKISRSIGTTFFYANLKSAALVQSFILQQVVEKLGLEKLELVKGYFYHPSENLGHTHYWLRDPATGREYDPASFTFFLVLPLESKTYFFERQRVLQLPPGAKSIDKAEFEESNNIAYQKALSGQFWSDVVEKAGDIAPVFKGIFEATVKEFHYLNHGVPLKDITLERLVEEEREKKEAVVSPELIKEEKEEEKEKEQDTDPLDETLGKKVMEFDEKEFDAFLEADDEDDGKAKHTNF